MSASFPNSFPNWKEHAERYYERERCSRQLAAEAEPIDGVPALANYLARPLSELYKLSDWLSPHPDHAPCGAPTMTPDAWRRLRSWHAVGLAIDELNRRSNERDRQRRAQQAQKEIARAETLLQEFEVGR